MIWQADLYLLAGIAGVATLLYFVPVRKYLSSATAAGVWTYIAFSAAEIQTQTQAGIVMTRIGSDVQYVTGFLAAVSFFVLVASVFGIYPPEDTESIDEPSGDNSIA